MELSIPGVGAFPVSTAAYGQTETFRGVYPASRAGDSGPLRAGGGGRGRPAGPLRQRFPPGSLSPAGMLCWSPAGWGWRPCAALLQALAGHRRTDRGDHSPLRFPGTGDAAFPAELEGLAAAGQIRLRFSVDFATELPWAAGGRLCKVGLVTELLDDLQFAPARTAAAVCGPPALYSACRRNWLPSDRRPERSSSPWSGA